jgi:hypothetical protein
MVRYGKAAVMSVTTQQIVLSTELQESVSTQDIAAAHYSLRWLTTDGIDLIDASPDRPAQKAPRSYFEEKVIHGAKICGAFSKTGELVAWRLFQPCYQDLWNWLRVQGDDRSVCGFAAFTIPQVRGQRLMRSLTAFASEHFLELGFRTLIAVTDAKNPAAIAGHRNIGMRTVGTITARRYPLGLRIIEADGRKHVGFFRCGKRFTYVVAPLHHELV